MSFVTQLDALVSVFAASIDGGVTEPASLITLAAKATGSTQRRAEEVLHLLTGIDPERHLWTRTQAGGFAPLLWAEPEALAAGAISLRDRSGSAACRCALDAAAKLQT